MAREIERKFLVLNDEWRAAAGPGVRLRQGYLAITPQSVTRVRVHGDDKAFITVKSAEKGVSRDEYEYRIPVEDAVKMLRLCAYPVIDKTRFEVDVAGNTWEVDVFAGDNEGLIVAEIELPSEDTVFEKPSWAGREVTQEDKYFNAALAMRPYKMW
jgi:adenylate cyclase